MRRVFFLVFTLFLLTLSMAAQAATVTGARWGQQKGDGLRFVVDVSGSAKYSVKLEEKLLTLTIDSEPAAGIVKSYPINKKLADTMSLKKLGSKSILEVPLKQTVNKEDYKVFTLANPYRIVMDVAPKGVTVGNNSGNKGWMNPVVPNSPSSSTVKKPTNAGSTWSPNENSNNSNGSWRDRFKSGKNGQTPSQRVKQSIEEAKKAKEGTTGVTVKPQSSTQTGTPVKDKASKSQSDLKKQLAAKKKARKEQAAKNKKTSTVKPANTSTKVEDGILYIKGNGQYRTSGGIKGKVIALDAGHGGSDPGAIGAGGTREKNITLPIAKQLKELLTSEGAKVYMTRETDIDVAGAYASDRAELQGRVNVAEKYNADIFVSIHINSAENRSLAGLACYYHPKTSQDARLARAIQNRLLANLQMNDLGIREANFYVNKRCTMPSSLLELGFISNAKEESTMKTAWFQQRAAKAIFEGIREYFK